MIGWDEEYINEEVQVYIEFEAARRGAFQFGYVQGEIDCRESQRDGKPYVEWTWEGNDEMEPAMERGWAVLDSEGLDGMIFFHQGDESNFMAQRAKK